MTTGLVVALAPRRLGLGAFQHTLKPTALPACSGACSIFSTEAHCTLHTSFPRLPRLIPSPSCSLGHRLLSSLHASSPHPGRPAAALPVCLRQPLHQPVFLLPQPPPPPVPSHSSLPLLSSHQVIWDSHRQGKPWGLEGKKGPWPLMSRIQTQDLRTVLK